MTDKSRVVLIDLSSIFWAAYHVGSESGVREPRAWTLEGVKRAVGEGSPLVAVCCDSGRSFRKDLSPEYKANREKQPAAAYGELEKIKDRLRADGFLLWEVEGFEADDVIGTACKMALDRLHEVRIATSDKDLLQLVNVKVDVLRTHTWEVWDSRKTLEKFMVQPEQIRDYLALVGDASDNVPGCAKVGGKTAADLLTRYETIDRLYEALDAGREVAGRAVEASLRENRKAVELSRKLVTLRYDVPIAFDEIYAERKVTPLTENSELPPENDELPSDEGATNATGPENLHAQPTGDPVDAAKSESSTENVSLVPVQVEYTKQLEPRSMSHAVWLGKHLLSSRLYSRFPTAEAITAVILRGRELGLGAATALDVFHVIEGRPVPHAYLIIARAKADPDCEYFYCENTTADAATWVTKNKRNPKEQRLTYTLEQAKSSGLVKTGQSGRPNQWMVRPAEMVRKTAGVQLARMEYPAATLGLYAWEELAGNEDQ